MAKFLLPSLKISTDNHEQDVKELLKTIKPSWKVDSIIIENLSGGFSARMLRCYVENDPLDSVTVRIRHLTEELSQWKNNEELKMIQHLSTNGHFPTVHAIFANGYCYQYILGKTIINPRKRHEGSINDKTLRHIAKELAYINQVRLDGMDYSETNNFGFCKMLYGERDFANLHDLSPSKEAMFEELEFLQEYLTKKNPKIVTCHGDLHSGNIVWDEENEKITVVDWECVHSGYQLQNIAHFFVTASILDPFCSNRTVEDLLPSDFKRKFIRSYLEAWYGADKEKHEISEEEVETWLQECEYFTFVPLWSFVAMAKAFADSVDEFSGDKIRFHDLMLNEYLSLKEKLFGRRSFGKQDIET